jgi:hypothetical protein
LTAKNACLKFNQSFEKVAAKGNRIMQPNGVSRATGITPYNATSLPQPPLVARFLGKFVLDILPAALASVIGGFLFTQYQFIHATALRPATEAVAPASAEMIQMVRDEHAMLIDYLKAQRTAEKNRLAGQDDANARAEADAKAAADAKANVEKAVAEKAIAGAAVRRVAAAAKPTAARAKPPVVAVSTPAVTPHAPLVIAQAEQNDGAAAQPGRLARDPDSLLAKTLDIKDHVVDATRHVVSAIGDVFASIGERIGGGANPDAAPATRQFSSAS